MIYGYARVSTVAQSKGKQTEEEKEEKEKKKDKKELISNSFQDQELQLKRAGATEIIFEAMSGKNAERPELKSLLAKMKAGDQLIVLKLDRLSRSAKDGLNIVDDLLEKGCKIEILNMGKFDSTPMGDLARTMMFGFAQFERAMILERTSAGKAIARLKPDYKEGRPKQHLDKIDTIKLLLDNNVSIRKISKGLSIPYSSCKRLVDEIKGAELNASSTD